MDRTRKDTVMTALLLIAGGALVCAMWPVRVAPVLRLTLQRNATPIVHLDQVRSIVAARDVFVDRLDLSRGGRLRHAELGDIGDNSTDGNLENLFLGVRKRFTVLSAGDYRFLVSSDDGFSLRIDNRPLCADPRPRAMSVQTCGIRLDAGAHEFALDYFQGSGQSGLTVQYGRQDQSSNFWFGQDSAYFRFELETP